jgi:chorismate synthase
VVSVDATTAPVAESGIDVDASRIDIRHVRTHDEFVQCVDLQAATWGADFRESVPATILKITQRLGGVTAGAFAPDGSLLGFIFGVTGIERGLLVHWSDMLAVDAAAQNHGIGRRLKEFQRESLRALGVTRMYWTYDPLVARNAHFNLNRLGAQVMEYVPDMYGADTGSALHSGLGTDRFIVVWPITPARDEIAGRTPPASLAAWSSAPILNAASDHSAPAEPAPIDGSLPDLARVEIPADILRLQQDHIAEAARWRRSTRHAFQWALANGYRVEWFQREPSSDHGYYLLARVPAATSTEQ